MTVPSPGCESGGDEASRTCSSAAACKWTHREGSSRKAYGYGFCRELDITVILSCALYSPFSGII